MVWSYLRQILVVGVICFLGMSPAPLFASGSADAVGLPYKTCFKYGLIFALTAYCGKKYGENQEKLKQYAFYWHLARINYDKSINREGLFVQLNGAIQKEKTDEARMRFHREYSIYAKNTDHDHFNALPADNYLRKNLHVNALAETVKSLTYELGSLFFWSCARTYYAGEATVNFGAQLIKRIAYNKSEPTKLSSVNLHATHGTEQPSTHMSQPGTTVVALSNASRSVFPAQSISSPLYLQYSDAGATPTNNIPQSIETPSSTITAVTPPAS